MEYLLQHLLDASVQRWPDRPAVVFEGSTLSYRELDEASTRLAAFLQRQGVQPGERVGLHVGKSLGAIVSMFGVLKAGAAYVPLDPIAPGSRLGFMLRDSGVRCVISGPAPVRRGRTEPILQEQDALDALIICEGEPDERPLGLPARTVYGWSDAIGSTDNPRRCRMVDTDLAYILYTSGSTGEPKGVMISHLNALTFVRWCHDTFQIQSDDRLSNHAPFHFDLSVFDIFAAIQAGASVHLVPEGLSTFPIRLGEWIERAAITVWYSVPSALTLLANHGKLAARTLGALRLVLFAGEVFPLKHLQTFSSLVPHAQYFNLYGPTETNVCTYHQVNLDELANRTSPLPIGQPCANMDVFALTEQSELVTQVGQVGELLVRGSGVALGYWSCPERTAAAFIQNPLAPNARDIVYRTGDLVTLDERGNYLYLGRQDHQIKSRGYRIELGEVEAVLYRHPQVAEAAVVPVPDDLVGNRIKAVVVPTEGAMLDPSDLQARCAADLPRYMVPEIVEIRTRLPRTGSGKVDLVALVNTDSNPIVTRSNPGGEDIR